MGGREKATVRKKFNAPPETCLNSKNTHFCLSPPTAWHARRQCAVVPWPSCWSLWLECVWHSSPWRSPRKQPQVKRSTLWQQQVRCLQTASQRVHCNTSVFLTGLEPTPVPSQETEHKPYLIGVGRADCTGPPAEIPLVSRGTHEQPPFGPQLELWCKVNF